MVQAKWFLTLRNLQKKVKRRVDESMIEFTNDYLIFYLFESVVSSEMRGCVRPGKCFLRGVAHTIFFQVWINSLWHERLHHRISKKMDMLQIAFDGVV